MFTVQTKQDYLLLIQLKEVDVRCKARTASEAHMHCISWCNDLNYSTCSYKLLSLG